MLEPLGKRILLSLSLCALPILAGAESLPPGIRACAAETDSLRRLVCYDREVARFTATQPTESRPTTKREPVPATSAGTATAANSTPPLPPASPAVPTTEPSTPASASSSSSPPAPLAARASQDSGKKDAAHFSAQVVSIDRAPNEMVLHLDNGQAWQQLQQVPGDLTLQVGDTVKIDKHLGSFWLTGPHVSGMKVRQKS